MPKILRLFIIGLTLLLGACSLLPELPGLKIHLQSSVDANASTAIAVDVVFVYDDKLVSSLPATADAWFQDKTVFVNASPTAFDVVHVEVPPAMQMTVNLPNRHRSAKAILLYAHYSSAQGQLVHRLNVNQCVNILLEREQPVYRLCP